MSQPGAGLANMCRFIFRRLCRVYLPGAVGSPGFVWPQRRHRQPGDKPEPAERRCRELLLLQASDVADLVLYALDLPEHAELTDVHVRPARRS